MSHSMEEHLISVRVPSDDDQGFVDHHLMMVRCYLGIGPPRRCATNSPE